MSLNPAKNYSSSWLLPTIKIGLFACLFMPLIVNGNFIFPYIFPKQAFFQIVVEIVLALYLFLALKDSQYRPRSSWLWRALLAYFFVMILSSVFGANFYHSLWSNYERMAGVVSLFHYLGFLFVAANIFKSAKDWYAFFDVSIIAGILQALFGLGQLAGIFASSGGVRIDGTIGNASFLAGYMLINALFAFWLMIEKESFSWRVFYGLAIIINLVILYKTETRGAVVGLLAGLAAMGLFFIFARQKDLAQLPLRSPSRARNYIIGLFVAGLALSGAIWLARESSFVKSSPTLHRVTHINLTETTAQTRLLAWKMSLRGFLERPVFGWGPENYYIVFNKFYDPQLYPVESWFDRAHNAYFDILVNTGLAGAVAYLFAAALAGWSLWSAWRRAKIKYHTLVIFSAVLIAYAIQNFFVFDTQVTLLMISSILAFIVFLSFPSEISQTGGQVIRPNIFFTLVIFLVTLFSIYFINIKPGLAGATGINALQSLQAGNWEQSLEKFKTAFDIGTFGLPEVAMRGQDAAIQLIQNSKIPTAVRNQFVELAVDGMNRALELEPLNTRFMMILSSVYLSSAGPDNSYLAEADNLLRKALELSPTRQELYFYLGQARMFQNRPDDALALFKQAVELNDKVALSHWNYGIIAIGVGQKELGAAEIARARSLGHSFGPDDINQLIKAYARTNDVANVIALYQEWAVLAPNDAAPFAGLAAVLAQTGEKQKAKEMAEQAAAIDSSYKDQAEQFIKGLGL
ncbi:O-antigen ligase family protein [Patescibacteria group bacterium]|nr:O-antigen ligase family protein [Patescibacteria group bacterium]